MAKAKKKGAAKKAAPKKAAKKVVPIKPQMKANPVESESKPKFRYGEGVRVTAYGGAPDQFGIIEAVEEGSPRIYKVKVFTRLVEDRLKPCFHQNSKLLLSRNRDQTHDYQCQDCGKTYTVDTSG